ATVGLMIIACGFALVLENALQVFNVVLQVGAGTGLLLILRWFWWRINAASELTAMVVSFLVAVYFTFIGGEGLADWERLVWGVAITTVAWVAVAYLTPATDTAVLRAFYQKIQPGGPGWAPVLDAARADGLALDDGQGSDLPTALLAALLGVFAIYSILFTTGFVLYGQTTRALAFGGLALAFVAGLAVLWPRLRFGESTEAPAEV
ncbi:MAG: Na+:solute symporter, partial [Bacteroidota bacterium]